MPVDRRRTKRSGMKSEKQDVKPTPQVREVFAEPMLAKVGEESARPLDEFLGRAQKAYITYLEAQKDVWKAFNETQQRVEDDYRETEHRANRERDEAVEQYLISRSASEQEAERVYTEAMAQVQQTYADAKEEARRSSEERLRQALATYKQTIEQARIAREESIERARKIFS